MSSQTTCSEKIITVIFVGLPSAGKTSLINALHGMLVGETGKDRTTLGAKEYARIATDDAGNRYKIIDTPGVCDSKDTTSSYDDLVRAYATKADLIIWCSDSAHPMRSTEEVKAFDKLRTDMTKIGLETGVLYRFAIALTKCSMPLSRNALGKERSPPKAPKAPEIGEDGELELDVEAEHTSAFDVIDDVFCTYSDRGIPVLITNAHGMSMRDGASDKLKAYVRKCLGYEPTQHNVTWNLTPFLNDMESSVEDHEFNCFSHWLETSNKSKLLAEFNRACAIFEKSTGKLRERMIDLCTKKEKLFSDDSYFCIRVRYVELLVANVARALCFKWYDGAPRVDEWNGSVIADGMRKFGVFKNMQHALSRLKEPGFVSSTKLFVTKKLSPDEADFVREMQILQDVYDDVDALSPSGRGWYDFIGDATEPGLVDGMVSKKAMEAWLEFAIVTFPEKDGNQKHFLETLAERVLRESEATYLFTIPDFRTMPRFAEEEPSSLTVAYYRWRIFRKTADPPRMGLIPRVTSVLTVRSSKKYFAWYKSLVLRIYPSFDFSDRFFENFTDAEQLFIESSFAKFTAKEIAMVKAKMHAC